MTVKGEEEGGGKQTVMSIFDHDPESAQEKKSTEQTEKTDDGCGKKRSKRGSESEEGEIDCIEGTEQKLAISEAF